MENENIKHTFVICAYKESPYLEECIKSLKHQKTKSVSGCAACDQQDCPSRKE